ncbi:hypothetical protein KJ611_00405 [Patescibacteria group bacterium]|nr:hypothetical protein [Patescibacteria group bacterium]
MKKILMILGIIAAGLIVLFIVAIVVLAIVKPFGINVTQIPKALISPPTESAYDHPLLNTEQEIMLESVGIDPQDIPTQVTPTQEACSVEALGQNRVDEIKAGAAPSLTDYLKSKHCYE